MRTRIAHTGGIWVDLDRGLALVDESGEHRYLSDLLPLGPHRAHVLILLLPPAEGKARSHVEQPDLVAFLRSDEDDDYDIEFDQSFRRDDGNDDPS